jgi:glutamate synthase domain-containing protein 1
MCGIVGLLLKNEKMRANLGELMTPMLVGMTSRGPDSAGVAVFGEPVKDKLRKLSLFWREGTPDWKKFEREVDSAWPGSNKIRAIRRHAILLTSSIPDPMRRWIADTYPQVYVLSVGRSIDLYKDIGAPADIVARYGLNKVTGTHVVAHTRMATESAVTPQHAHPFTAGQDFCLVHNGSLSNPHLVRKKLEPLGIRFVTDNDTEAACRFFEWRMREGDDLTTAVQRGFSELDGFFTFLMGTDKEMLIVRDAFACKPAVVAETDDYVAIASEFRSLAHLPGVRHAHVFEPKPEQVYAWKA